MHIDNLITLLGHGTHVFVAYADGDVEKKSKGKDPYPLLPVDCRAWNFSFLGPGRSLGFEWP